MADPTPAEPTSPRSTLGAAPLLAVRGVWSYQNPGQVGLAGPGGRSSSDDCGDSPSVTASIYLLPGNWQDLSSVMLQIPEPKPASGAMIIANNFKTCPELHLRCRSHPPVRKEGL